jgi:uncharacterized membrane protein SpoIIM required for sporulation
MREALFVKQSSERWKEYENLSNADPDTLADSFIQITDDLAYARTFFPKSNTTQYLNGIAATFHQSIYRNRKEKTNRFFTFWKQELPLIFFEQRKIILYSLVFFLVFCMMGALSAKYDNAFIRLILGDNYVNMTNENISKGDPFGVYKQEGEFYMFFSIAINNISVALLMFVMGIIFSAGSLYMLLFNGIMVGSFQYYFFSRGLGWQSVLVVWCHGTLEMSSIILAGAAGIIMGNSFLFPKTYSRMESLKKGAKDGLKIAIGVVPIILTAAFFEGFVTRHTEMPVWISVAILVSSFCFITWYVVIYPAILNQKINHNNQLNHEPAN